MSENNVFENIGLAQINPESGNIEYNAKKIREYIENAEKANLDLVVFPELSLIGAPIGDTIGKHPNIISESIKWLNSLAKITNNTAAIIGFAEPINNNPSKFYNSAAVLRNGKIEKIFRKSHFSGDYIFKDYRYMEKYPAENYKIYEINGKKYGILIGDDYKSSDLANVDGFINLISLPFVAKYIKEASTFVKKNHIPCLYVNRSGYVDNFSFEGKSGIISENGEISIEANCFEEQLLIAKNSEYKTTQSIKDKNSFDLDYEEDLERTYKIIIQGIKDYFSKCGLKRAVLGLSGGLDSTVCAVLLTDALGKDNVLGVSMPSKLTSNESKSDAKQLADNLGINFTEVSIKPIVDTSNEVLQPIFSDIEKGWNCRYEKSYTQDNIQARTRATYLWSISNEFSSCIPIATSDKSEAYMGYATINGDMSGGFAPIADITKTKLFALARWLNKNRSEKNAIPESVINKRPGAELAIDPNTGKTLCAEDALMPYEFLDEVIWRIEKRKENYYDMLNSKFLYEKKYELSSEKKEEWLKKFYSRMSAALYKWSIMPPSIITEENTINGALYSQPITTGKINYIGLREDEIDKILART